MEIPAGSINETATRYQKPDGKARKNFYITVWLGRHGIIAARRGDEGTSVPGLVILKVVPEQFLQVVEPFLDRKPERIAEGVQDNQGIDVRIET